MSHCKRTLSAPPNESPDLCATSGLASDAADAHVGPDRPSATTRADERNNEPPLSGGGGCHEDEIPEASTPSARPVFLIAGVVPRIALTLKRRRDRCALLTTGRGQRGCLASTSPTISRSRQRGAPGSRRNRVIVTVSFPGPAMSGVFTKETPTPGVTSGAPGRHRRRCRLRRNVRPP